MAVLKQREIKNMNAKDRIEKLKELEMELLKASIPGKTKVKPKEIKKTMARIITLQKKLSSEKS